MELVDIVRSFFLPSQDRSLYEDNVMKKAMRYVSRDSDLSQYVQADRLDKTEAEMREGVKNVYDEMQSWVGLSNGIDTIDSLVATGVYASAFSKPLDRLFKKVIMPVELLTKLAFQGAYYLFAPIEKEDKKKTAISWFLYELPGVFQRNRIASWVGATLDLFDKYIGGVQGDIAKKVYRGFKESRPTYSIPEYPLMLPAPATV